MGDFKPNNRSGGNRGGNRSGGFSGGNRGGGFGGGNRGGGFGGNRERRPLEMHDATCEKCKNKCQVPFKPSGSKPVLCSDCYKSEGNSGSRNNSSSSGISEEQYKELNTKLDNILELLKKE